MTLEAFGVPNGFNTKMRIVTALNDLIVSKDFERVKVSEICAAADVSRSTFYHHFEDKNAILQWHSAIAYNAGVDQIGRSMNWIQGHVVTTRFLSRYLDLYLYGGRGGDYGNVRKFFVRRRIEILRETVRDYHGVELTPELEFQIRATANMEAAMADERYNKNISEDIEEYCRLLSTCIPKELYDITNSIVDDSGKGLSLAILLDSFLTQ